MDTMNKTIDLEIERRIRDLEWILEALTNPNIEHEKPFVVISEPSWQCLSVGRNGLEWVITDYPWQWTHAEAMNAINEVGRPSNVRIIPVNEFYERRIEEYKSILNAEQ